MQSVSEICSSPAFDAIVTTGDGETYVFKAARYWKLTADSVAPGYPRNIAEDWAGLPDNIDAAFTWNKGKTYFFKGSKYWKFSNQKMDVGYPRQISSRFYGMPKFPDAALVWSQNIYFFKGRYLITSAANTKQHDTSHISKVLSIGGSTQKELIIPTQSQYPVTGKEYLTISAVHCNTEMEGPTFSREINTGDTMTRNRRYARV